MAAYDYGGFSLKVLIDRATQRLALAEDFDRKGDLQGAYGEYKKWAEMMQAILTHAERKAVQAERGTLYLQLRALNEKFQPAKSRMTDIRTALQSSQQSNPNTTFSASWAESEEEPDTPKRQSLADRIQALSNAGVNTSKAPAYMHPQPHSAVLNGFSKHSLGTTQEEAPQEASPSAIPTPSRSHHSRPLPTTPNTVSRQPSPVSNIERPASQPLARSAADEAEKEFHSHFPSVDALEQEFPSMPTAPTHSLGKPKSNGTSTRNGLPDSLTPASNTGLSHSPSHVSFVDSIRGQSQPEASTSKSPLSDHAESKSNVPLGNGMLPNILHSYLQTTSSGILIIDVRSRPEFERAHFAPPNPRSVTICLEPITLRHALDATQLAASMFDSRPEEKEAFTKRAEFALIVVIDQSSSAMPSTPSMAASSEEYKYLFNLNQAIYVNEFRAPLPRPPVLLIGGMDAWEEAFGTKLLMGSAVDTSRGRSASSHLKRDSAYGDAPAKKANRKAKVTEGEMYGYNIARNVGDVIGYSGSPGQSSSYQGPAQNEYFSRPSMPNSSSFGSSGITGPPVAFPPSILPKTTPPPISYNKPDPFTSPPASLRDSNAQQPLSPNASLSNSFHRPPINYPHLAPTSQPNQPSSGTDLQRPPLAAQPNSFGRSPYPDQPHHRRLSHNNYKPVNLNELPQWLDGRVGMTGLKNLGNTCYMNSTLQCLSATIPFAKFFTEGTYRKFVNTVNPLGTKGQLAKTIGTLFTVLWQEQYNFVSPVSFRDAICHFAPQFRGTDQHDSQEFLAFLLDGLHEDLNMVQVKPKPIEFTPEREAELETLSTKVASAKEWDIYLMRDNSIIVQWFQGQYRSRLQCLTCGKTSTTYNAFMYLSLPLPTKPSKVTLDQCLEAFVSEEILDKDDAWHCPACKKPRKASKRLTIARLPPVLLIHLKRFAFKGPFSERIDTHVNFPVYGLDMSRFLPQGSPADKLYASQGPATASDRALYDLYGISQHFGTLSSGHYTAIARNRSEWKHIGDSRVTDLSESDVRKATKSTYILFYRLQQPT